MRRISPLIFILFITFSYSQNKQLLYGFAELPQTLLLNPGAETNYKFHIGVPLLSGISSELGSTGFSMSDLFLNDGISITDKVNNVLNKLDSKDHLKFNMQLELFSGGFRYDDKKYFSFGIYEEVDVISYFPKDVSVFFTEGNSPYLDRQFSISDLMYKADVLTVLHFGVTKKVDKQLTVGGRFKIYTSTLNSESFDNTGTLTTVNGTNNIYAHHLSNLNVNIRTSGLMENDEMIQDPGTYLKNTLLGGNLGFGFDFGFTYHQSDQLEFTGSIIDLGFIKHTNNITNYYAYGNYTLDGIEFLFPNERVDYWHNLQEDFEEKVPNDENQDSYISWRPTKLNGSLKYSFGEKRSKYCYDNTFKNFYSNALGIQLNAVFRPLRPQLALTGFYQKSFLNKLHTKVTYTIDEYSFYNVGAGISAQIGKVNFYGLVDNIANFNDIASANNVSLQLGINLIFN
ncbi:DUF5723 family protein [Polaribacter sargassicola]|uniref:DUF5723 family protein n=1 Tax=Polaribacter sargassicola TaxID=2836891 RepID=UPI001F1F4995|nr:DUF5723 family protein [Polaribacter sp. DS7-9]MCG1035717.1 hypothetical protein [Polaribacter sp. DS7-9]